MHNTVVINQLQPIILLQEDQLTAFKSMSWFPYDGKIINPLTTTGHW